MKNKYCFIIFSVLLLVCSCNIQNNEIHTEDNDFIMINKTFQTEHGEFTLLLNGVKKSNADFAFESIKKNFNTEKSFSVNHKDFVDAEKISLVDENGFPISDDGDYSLCWAASCSNNLLISGWNAGFTNEDEIFDFYRNTYLDKANYFQFGISWFFNGIVQQSKATTYLKNDEIRKSDFHYPEIVASKLVTVIPFSILKNNPDKLNSLKDILPTSCVELSIDGHSVTMQGAIFNADNELVAIIISNSDNNISSDPQKKAINTYDFYPVVKTQVTDIESGTYVAWRLLDYGDGSDKTIQNVRYLPKKKIVNYQDVIEKKGSKNICKNIEFEFRILQPGDPEFFKQDEENLKKGIYTLFIYNDSYINIEETEIYLTINFYNQQKLVRSFETKQKYPLYDLKPPFLANYKLSMVDDYKAYIDEPGEYEFEIIGNHCADEKNIIPEAYYENNSTGLVKIKYE